MRKKFNKKDYIEDIKYRQGRDKHRVAMTEKVAGLTIIGFAIIFIILWLTS